MELRSGQGYVAQRGANGRARIDTHGKVRVLEGPARGELALRPGWPSMFRGYLHDPERGTACFTGGWDLSGDIARRDTDGATGTRLPHETGRLHRPEEL